MTLPIPSTNNGWLWETQSNATFRRSLKKGKSPRNKRMLDTDGNEIQQLRSTLVIQGIKTRVRSAVVARISVPEISVNPKCRIRKYGPEFQLFPYRPRENRRSRVESTKGEKERPARKKRLNPLTVAPKRCVSWTGGKARPRRTASRTNPHGDGQCTVPCSLGSLRDPTVAKALLEASQTDRKSD